MDKTSIYITVIFCLAASTSSLADMRLEHRVNTQVLAAHQDLEEKSIINAGNPLELNDRLYELDFRPDFSLRNRQLFLGLKPRFVLTRARTERAAGYKKTDRESDIFIQEWLARVQLNDELFISYGRENLQWGPARLLSASNPFLAFNGRDVPQREVGGMDYARLVWVNNDLWTSSLIVNTDDGRQNISGNTNSYAIKVDYTRRNYYFSLIPSLRKGDNNSDDVAALGFFGVSNINDALLVYLEGSVAEQHNSQGLAGISYTFKGGSNLVFEYYHQQGGCSREPVHTCLSPGITSTTTDRTGLLRKNYLFLQLVKDWDNHRTNLVARAVYNLDDNSKRFTLYLNRGIGDHWSTFAVATVTKGDEHTEFGSLINSSVVAGIEYTF